MVKRILALMLPVLPAFAANAQGVTGDWRARLAQGQQQIIRDIAAPALATWIRRSRDEAVAAGVAPIPAHIRRELLRIYPPALLDRARFRVGGGSALSLSANSFGIGHAEAITLDDVVVFRTAGDAASPHLWAHEIGHVAQYAQLGTDAFALHYLQDWRSLESEAQARADAYAAACRC